MKQALRAAEGLGRPLRELAGQRPRGGVELAAKLRAVLD